MMRLILSLLLLPFWPCLALLGVALASLRSVEFRQENHG